MSALAASAVTVVNAWTGGDVTGKRYTYLKVTLVLDAQGSEANPIPASALGLDNIEGAGTFVKSDNTVLLTAGPDYTRVNLLLTENGTPTDQTGTFNGIVFGPLYEPANGAGS